MLGKWAKLEELAVQCSLKWPGARFFSPCRPCTAEFVVNQVPSERRWAPVRQMNPTDRSLTEG